MIPAAQLAGLSPKLWFRLGLISLLLAASQSLALAQSSSAPRTKTPANFPERSQAAQPAQDQGDPLAGLIQQAKDAVDKNDFASALEPLQKILAQRPEDPFTHFQLGFAYAGLKRNDDAKIEFSRAIALDPKMAAAHLNLGLLLLDGDPGAAAESFRHSAELQPTESRPRFLEGAALERAGKFPDAIEQYRAALALSPKDYEYQFSLGRALLRAGNAADAETHFREAVAARGDSAPAHLGLANALLAQKKYEEGADALAEYLKLDPSDRAQRIERASALVEIARLDDAIAELDRADAGSAQEAGSLKVRAGIYMQQKQWPAAAKTLRQAIALSPQDAELPAWLGHADFEMHDYPAAIVVLGQAIAMDPKSPDPLRDVANAFFLSEEYASALGAMDRLAKLEPPKPGSWFVRAICYDKLSLKAEAVDAYQKFLDLDNGQNDTQDFQARQRMLTLKSELAKSPKKK